MNAPILSVIVLITFTTCMTGNIKHSNNNTQVVEYKSQFYDTVGNGFSKPFMIFKEKIWYKDSMAIESVSSQNIITDTNMKTTEQLIIIHYRFSDLRSRLVYEYKNFSDTAAIIQKYSYDDTIPILGGWNFKWLRKTDYNGTPEALPDTNIDNISYKRIRLSKITPDNSYAVICYFRCEQKGTVFNFDPSLSEKVGCPLVKKYYFSLSQKGKANSSEINFLSNRFTTEELKVFDAWEKNIKQYPVSKK